MKRTQHIAAVFAALIIVIAAIFGAWYFAPKVFLKDVEASQVMSIAIFDGNTGKLFTVDNSEEIEQIVENIQGIEMKRGKLSGGCSGFAFSMKFMGEGGTVIDRFTINAPNTIKADTFFYRCSSGSLCFDYLQELEGKYAG